MFVCSLWSRSYPLLCSFVLFFPPFLTAFLIIIFFCVCDSRHLTLTVRLCLHFVFIISAKEGQRSKRRFIFGFVKPQRLRSQAFGPPPPPPTHPPTVSLLFFFFFTVWLTCLFPFRFCCCCCCCWLVGVVTSIILFTPPPLPPAPPLTVSLFCIHWGCFLEYTPPSHPIPSHPISFPFFFFFL